MKTYSKYISVVVNETVCFIIISAIAVQTVTSCKKFIKVDAPITSLNLGNVFTTDATAVSVLTDVYANMSAQNNSTANNPLQTSDITSISLFAGLGADELTLFNLNNQNLLASYQNDLTSRTATPNYWSNIYQQIFKLNNAIEGMGESTTLNTSVKQQLVGEAAFMRALFYFYLVNIYGDVPLVLTSDWKTNALLSRASQAEVYQQILIDLKLAKDLLASSYLKGDALTPYATNAEERIRPTKWAAIALLSRAYLYAGDWTNAEAEANTIIDNSSLFDINIPLNSCFIKNSKDTIWALQPVGNNAYANTGEGKLFILSSAGPNVTTSPVYLSNSLVSAFEAGDIRKNSWVDSVKLSNVSYHYAKKYKIGNVIAASQEYPIVLRFTEQYLIRAEARTHQGNVIGAKEDLNAIRKRANLGNITATDKETLLEAILHERQVELFTEWGHRWFDLKRTNNVNSVMGQPLGSCALKGGTWVPYKVYNPVPQADIDKDPNLVQNDGY